jgi:rieske iron-sulfur protein
LRVLPPSQRNLAHSRIPLGASATYSEFMSSTDEWAMTQAEHHCGGCAAGPTNAPRRRVIQIAAAGLASPWTLMSTAQGGGPRRGDRLVDDDAEGPPTPLRVSDLRVGKPMLAFPFDASKQVLRNDSRLHKVVLLRLAEADLNAETQARAAGGVIAFSALCTHQACEVKTWLSKEKSLVCFCHSSKFDVLDGAKVTAGPAPRALPMLPLVLEGDLLVVAGSFSSEPGGAT